MNLPIKLFGKKKQEVSYFLALTLRDEQIGAYILKEIEGHLHVIGKNEETLKLSIEQLQEKESVEILDRVISKAEETLPQNILTRKTMFGVKESWVEENKIKKDYLQKLKKICDELGLQPTGFLVISEAIIHQLQEQEGAPLTAILVEIGKHQLTISYVRAGKIMETKHTLIVDSAVRTVDAVLKHFITATVLPARIVLFDGMHTETLTQEFISHQWSKSLPFLHMPQITPLPHGFDARSVILGAAEQMGLQVASDINLAGPAEKIAPPSPVTKTPPTSQTETAAEEPDQTLAQQFQQRLDERLSDTNETNEEEKTDEEKKNDTSDEAMLVSADNFGFVQDQDITSVTPPTQRHPHSPTPHAEEDEIDEEPHFHETPERKQKQKSSPLLTLQAVPGKIMDIFGGIFSGGSSRIPRWMFILPIILILIVAGIIWYILNVTATVQLTLKQKVTEEQGTISFSTNSGNDFSNNVVAAQDISVDLNGNSTTNATGSKDIGTSAKGTVTIYNNSDSPQTISSGTVITSSNNIPFTLDADVSVASKSGGADASPSTAQVAVTAKDIGSQANLPSGVTFSIAGSDVNTVDAKNENAFSGGSKKTVTVVSQADVNKLTTNLPQSLQDQATQQLQSKVPSGSTLVPGIVSTTLSKKVLNHNVGDQASSVSLSATVTFHGVAYKNQDLQDLAKVLLKDKFTDNSSLANNSITASISDVKPVDATTVKTSIDVKAGLLPKIDTQGVIQQITGTSVDQAKNILANEPQVDSSTISLHPNIPVIPQLLPRFPNHITVEMSSQ